MLGERDERSYVMQHSCRAQNTGMFFLELMQFLQLIEKTQRELRDLPSVEHIEVVFLSDLLQRLGMFGVLLLSERGVCVVPVKEVDHQSIAQPTLRDKNVVQFQLRHRFQKHHASGDDDIGPFGVTADERSSSRSGFSFEHVH